jgi:hypothetical protein
MNKGSVWTAFALFVFVFWARSAAADMDSLMGPRTLWQIPADCSDMSVWDVGMGMCMPLPMPGMPMQMLMVRGNIFGSRVWGSGPRGRSGYFSTQMVMADLGTTVGDRHYLNVDIMMTAERWTVPKNGYPLLLQIGEQNLQGLPFIDAQHPHSSPLMGLTFSDTISLGHEKNHIKVFFAPRGEVAGGPIAFMHRATGMINPDAPLGHHIGQDVGHISSTVIGASVKLGNSRLEGSIFHGAEPQPDQIDLPLGVPDSFSFRWVQEFSPQWMALVSMGRVGSPESDASLVPFENRYSASVYTTLDLASGWKFQNSLVYGVVTQYDRVPCLSSFLEEFLIRGERPRFWGRLEVLQRAAAQLAIPSGIDPSQALWVGALTLGYTHKVYSLGGIEFGVGGSITEHFLPADFIDAYRGNPWSGKVLLQIGGMEMGSL